MAKQAKKKAAEASKVEGLKFWAVTGYQKQDMEVVRYVQAGSAEDAVEEASSGEVIREDAPRGVDWGEWGANNIPEEDAEEVSEAEAKGEEGPDGSEEDARSVCPLWETIAPTLEECDPGYLLGHISVLGQLCHVEFVRAKKDREGCWQRLDGDAPDNGERIEEILVQAGESMPIGMDLPGHKGKWLIRVGPYCD